MAARYSIIYFSDCMSCSDATVCQLSETVSPHHQTLSQWAGQLYRKVLEMAVNTNSWL